jgi:hypothetical protein
MCIPYARSALALSPGCAWLRDIVAGPQRLKSGVCTSLVHHFAADFPVAVSHTFYSSACMSSMTAQMATVGTGQVDPISGSVVSQFNFNVIAE